MDTDKRRRGYAAVWLLASIAVLVLTIGGILWAMRHPPNALWMGGAVAVAAACLAIEARRDRIEFSRLAGVLAAFATLGAGLVVLLVGAHPAAIAAAGLSAIATGACGWSVWRHQHGPEPLRNVLREQVDDSAIQELDGVEEVQIELVFDPPWSPDLISEEARNQLGI